MTDRLTLTRAFEGAGLKSGDAERIATEIYDAIHANVASKADVAAVEATVSATRTELREEIAAVRADLGADIAALRAELVSLELRLTLRLGAVVVAIAGILFAALHYWPPRP